MLKVNKKDSRKTTLYIFQVCVFIFKHNVHHALILNEDDILKLNDFLDFIIIIFAVIFMIQFYFVFIVIIFQISLSDHKNFSSPLQNNGRKCFFQSPLEIFCDLFPLSKQRGQQQQQQQQQKMQVKETNIVKIYLYLYICIKFLMYKI